MSCKSCLNTGHHLFAKLGCHFQSTLLLILRLYWGFGFLSSGCLKFSNISAAIGFFHELGIPLPELNAYLVGTLECVGGLFLILGLGSRLVSFFLAIIMVVALVTAHHEGAVQILSNPQVFMAQPPVTFLLVALVVFAFGPGRFSIDYLLERSWLKKN